MSDFHDETHHFEGIISPKDLGWKIPKKVFETHVMLNTIPATGLGWDFGGEFIKNPNPQKTHASFTRSKKNNHKNLRLTYQVSVSVVVVKV